MRWEYLRDYSVDEYRANGTIIGELRFRIQELPGEKVEACMRFEHFQNGTVNIEKSGESILEAMEQAVSEVVKYCKDNPNIEAEQKKAKK